MDQGTPVPAPERGIRFQRITQVLDAVLAHAGLTICGLALISEYVDDGRISFPFPVSSGTWTSHVFQSRFRPDAPGRPQIRRFRDWLLGEARKTASWLEGMVKQPKPRRA
jgi:LysR family glycine cleavage system transcriptional activator